MRSLLLPLSLLLSSSPFSLAEPIAKPKAAPQSFSNNAPFSGAVYIVMPNGQQLPEQGSNFCPTSVPMSCSSVNQPSWCCPANYVCAVPTNSNGLIGCCPSGSTCAGSVNVAQVTTVTISPHAQTAVVLAQPPHVTVYDPAPPVVYGGFCQTLTMAGPGLPTVRQGSCGPILIVSSRGLPGLATVGTGMGISVVMLHFAFRRLYLR